jgi:hypothetical protein
VGKRRSILVVALACQACSPEVLWYFGPVPVNRQAPPAAEADCKLFRPWGFWGTPREGNLLHPATPGSRHWPAAEHASRSWDKDLDSVLEDQV